jgi:hypothetical protein
MNKLNKQMIEAIQATYDQGTRSVPALGARCMYRGSNGLKCTVGHAIPDEKYEESFEHQTVEDLVEEGLIDLDGEVNLWGCLQACHDNAPKGDFRSYFRDSVNECLIEEDYEPMPWRVK